MSFRRAFFHRTNSCAVRRAGRLLAGSLLLALLAACGRSAEPVSVTALEPERRALSLGVLPPERVMVALVFGQSNSANSGNVRADGGPGVYSFADGKLYEAADPLLGATGQGGSVWTRLGPKLLASGLYDAVVFAPVGVGGSAVSRWAVGGDLHPRLLGAVRGLQAQGLGVTHLLWHQGEADGALGTSTAAYRERFGSMLAGVRAAGVDAPVYVSVASRCAGRPLFEPVRQAQRELVGELSGIRAGPDTDLLGPSYRFDGCHFSPAGLERYAELWLEALGAVPHKLPQTLLFAPPGAKTLDEPPFSAAPYAAATSGLAASFATSSPAVCTVTEAGLVALVGAGTCTLSAGQTGNAVYAAAPSVTRSFTLTAPVTVPVTAPVTAPPDPPAETYLIDFERAPVNLLYSVKLGGGVIYTGAGVPTGTPKLGTLPVVGKRRLNSVLLNAHVARAVSVGGSRRLSVVSPNTATPAPQGGRLTLSFANLGAGGVTLTSLSFASLSPNDLTAGGASLTFLYAGGASSRQPLGAVLRGGSLKVPLGVRGVKALEVAAPAAFAVDDVAFTVEGR